MPSYQRRQSWAVRPPSPPALGTLPVPLGLSRCQAQFAFTSSFQDRCTHGECEREGACQAGGKKEGTCPFLLPEKPQQHSFALAATAGPSSVVVEPAVPSALRGQHLLRGKRAPPARLHTVTVPSSSLGSPALGAVTVSRSH